MALSQGPGVLRERGLTLEEFLERGQRHPAQAPHRLEQAVRPRGRGATDAKRQGVARSLR